MKLWLGEVVRRLPLLCACRMTKLRLVERLMKKLPPHAYQMLKLLPGDKVRRIPLLCCCDMMELWLGEKVEKVRRALLLWAAEMKKIQLGKKVWVLLKGSREGISA